MKHFPAILFLFISFCSVTFAQETTPLVDTTPKSNKKELIFLIVEEPATFQGGKIIKFQQWVASEIMYPREAVEMNQQGNVVIQFVVYKTGIVDSVIILRSSGFKALDQEAIRVIKSSPKWEPAKQAGQIVNQQFVIPISFTLAPDENIKKKR